MAKKQNYYQKHVAGVKRQNKKFEQATAGEKRVMIARDVLKHIKAEKLVARTGHFVHFGYDNRMDTMEERCNDDPIPMRERVAEIDLKPCKVCARGAIVFSAVMRRNACFVEDFDGADMIPEFPGDMMLKMEQYFEGLDREQDGQDHNAPGVVWCKRHRDPALRMELIMKNIIKNGGAFKPSQLP